MLLGIDFDNTIVCYDGLFHKVARERNLIPVDLPVNKSDVRNYLRKIGKEDVWTEMQGYVYGGRMAEASPYPGVLEFFKACLARGIEVRIVSHKTRYPFLGEKYDLHKAAQNWLEQQGFFDAARIGLPRENVFFELTKAEKLQRIEKCGCTHFIDDLPELLAEPSFPAQVEKILFDSNNLYSHEKFTRVLTWSEVKNLLLGNSRHKESAAAGAPTPHTAALRSATEENELRNKVGAFLRKQGVGEELTPLAGGGNNRVYEVRAGTEKRVLKIYFQNPADPRNRFGAEKAFYDLLWNAGVRRTPEPMGWDEENRLGLFSFVEGRKLSSTEVDESFVQQALQFILELNREKASAPAQAIQNASEACFSMAEHLACVERRVTRLQKIEGDSEIDRQAVAFVRGELEPRWKQVREEIAKVAGTDLEKVISTGERCLSPSDFGFHNALLPQDGRLRFFDFEYAGWDDPAKLICDFFCQPQIPVDLKFWKGFVQALSPLQLAPDWAVTETRAQRLLPAYQIKWCCIMLNEFIRSEQARRDFAKGADTAEERKKRQLEKVREALSKCRMENLE